MKKYDSLDVTKYILSYFVVAIHSLIFQNVLYPWLRIAVPIYFIISSFLFFSKVSQENTDGKKLLGVYVVRNFKLYAFWFVVLLPITIYNRQSWFSGEFWEGIGKALSSLLFSSTFSASWFIVASVEAVVLVYFASRGLSNKTMLCVSIAVYAVCFARSSLWFLLRENSVVAGFCEVYEQFLTSPVCSFPAALVWIVIGKMYAEGDFRWSTARHAVTALSSSAALYVEWWLIRQASGSMTNDCYMFLIPLCLSLFGLILKADITLKHARTIRKISTVMYASHYSVIILIDIIRNALHIGQGMPAIWKFAIAIAVCHAVSFVIFRL